MVDITASKLVELVVDAYQHFTTYQDTGVVRAWNDQTLTEDIFSTHFKRPSLYRFDFLSSHSHPDLREHTIYHAVVADQRRVFTYMKPVNSSAQVVEEVSLSHAVSKLTGVSLGAAYVVPRLLVDSIAGVSIQNFRDHQWGDDVVIAGSPCRQVHCLSPIGQCTICVETASLLIRRIASSGHGFEVEELRSNIQTNCEVDEMLFREPFVELLR